ncbi:type IV pilin [Halomicroarcula pellucida]|uniref:type IV pilin n=1 Tax=Haloarcula pellucida TaxID=1427151 RepID=UPI001C73A6CF|nr:type IV pilin [Halomicroarcula pellucida]MBX0349534.1 type IV pilin [Halomicroarcula pellucida]
MGVGKRGVSPVVGVALLVLIVVLLVTVAGTMATSLGSDALTSATVHSQAQYGAAIDEGSKDTLELRVRGYNQRAPETTFELQINGRVVKHWDGQSSVSLRCVYPGDHIYVASINGETSRKVEEYYVQEPTDCPSYNTFPAKFKYAIVDGTSHQINERYAFGLAIDPNGEQFAADYTGSNGMNLGPISLANPWHHIKMYERPIEGLDPPVFVVVMVDNVHWTAVPSPGYNWTDAPPSGLDPGEDAYSITDGKITTDSSSSTEPTNDVFLLFKPGCDQSTVVFVKNDAGYDNEIYLEGTKVIDDANSVSPGTVFTAPGVTCRGDASW